MRSAAPWVESRPPTPGVSTTTSPACSSFRGSVTSTERTHTLRLPGLPCSEHPRSAMRSNTIVSAGLEPSGEWSQTGGRHLLAVAHDRGRRVETSSATGHTAALSDAFTNVLLPCLNSPATEAGELVVGDSACGTFDTLDEIAPTGVGGGAADEIRCGEQVVTQALTSGHRAGGGLGGARRRVVRRGGGG